MAAAHNIFDASAAPQVGDRATESTYRKIELQSPADLTYLIANVNQAAQAKLDQHFGSSPTAAADDPATDTDPATQAQLRKRTEELVDAYIRATFTAAKDSLAIAGLDARELEAELAKIQEGEELEAFDGRLAQRVQQLSAQIEAQTLRTASLRRKGPQQTAQKYLATLARQTAADEARLQAQREAQIAAARETSIVVDRPTGQMGPARTDEVGGTYARGVQALARLQAEMGGTMEKMERAQAAAEVMVEEEQRSSR